MSRLIGRTKKAINCVCWAFVLPIDTVPSLWSRMGMRRALLAASAIFCRSAADHGAFDVSSELRRLSLTGHTHALNGRLLRSGACQSCTALPQCQSDTVVQCRRRWRRRTTFVKVFSSHIGDLRRGREIDDRLSTFGGGYREKLGEPCETRDQATAFIGEACCNETRMQTIRGHAGALQAPSKLARK